MSTTSAFLDAPALSRDGFAVVRAVIPRELCEAVGTACERALAGTGDSRRRAGVRGLAARVKEVRALADDGPMRDLACAAIGPGARLVRSILFDKSSGANWDVVWHQDTTIAVLERVDVAGFGPWSRKAGVDHVQPPARVLDGMVTIRLHLDDCGEDNGPLLVVPGSHRQGLLHEREIDAERCERDRVPCVVSAGDAVVMRPLLLHASKKAERPSRRRVVHVEFASADLPGGLAWARDGGP